MRLEKGKELHITISKVNGYKLTAGGVELAYTIDGKTPGTKDVVTNFETKAPEQTKNLHIKAADPEFAGEYSGTLIFALAFALCTACAVSALAADATSGTMNPTSGATEITTSIKPLRISFSTKGENSTRGTALCAEAPPATKNVGADSISARARLRQDKPPRAHIECAPTDFVFNIGLADSG